MVRLRLVEASGGLTKEEGFNPTMVRLRPVLDDIFWRGIFGFNPTMVRLRRGGGYLRVPLSIVSIPQWCDCDKSNKR